MYQDTLISDEGTLLVAIAELQNQNKLNVDQLLGIATDLGNSAKAIQFFDGSKIVDAHHLLSASQNALKTY